MIDAGMWNFENVVPRHVLEAKARRDGAKIAFGKLMTIMSWKNAESAAKKAKGKDSLSWKQCERLIWSCQSVLRDQNHPHNDHRIKH